MISPEALRPHYSRFLTAPAPAPAHAASAAPRVLLTGHSHQAWPDVARAAQLEAFDDAATYVDEKWGPAFAKADALRATIAARIGAEAPEIALAASTHELVARFLSALDLRARPRLVATSGEFHSMHRQLTRLAEEGVEVAFVPVGAPGGSGAPAASAASRRAALAEGVESLADRLAAALDERTSAVLVSSVLFESASVVPHLARLVARARALGVLVLVDAYHAFGVVPFSLRDLEGGPEGPRDVYLVAGGYKYAQWGEGNCFLRVPPASALRPIYTGWFSDFAHLDAPREGAVGGRRVGYGVTPADRFAGSTYDPTSHYRACAVSAFFAEQGLTLEALRALSLRQTGLILDELADVAEAGALEIVTPNAPERRGGFVALRVTPAARASQLVEALRARGVVTDSRGDVLRLGPAPYVTDAELRRACAELRALTAG
jgi:selenocysteine lyase/cysteine desulfurase